MRLPDATYRESLPHHREWGKFTFYQDALLTIHTHTPTEYTAGRAYIIEV